MTDDQYIQELEDIILELSEQTEFMYDAMNITVGALKTIREEFELAKIEEHSLVEVARTQYEYAITALSIVDDEPVFDKRIH